ncbi:flagellar motor switch protein FliN [Pusillimonas sp. (ex Stolz et al. 2005)]|jgi:flagellar motor switch protein FliN/FliY|uniref:flagellar motor switch protein FliN n=1 Tax=Pusillimonas sp. (ex Stolz et al. 2005) TaxID=1979962 RepID=UPI00261CA0F5|nr:flagellar motor switch protein FliN [Pusillimonas sp. (ex Stolz et al. 2005)]
MTDPKKDSDIENDVPETQADVDWAEAFAEQTAGHPETPTQAEGLQSDDWAAALSEQTAAENAAKAQPAASTVADLFQPLAGVAAEGESDIDLIMDIPVQLSVELGRTRLTIKNILQLGQGSVVELDGLAGEPMDIFVNGYLIAQGEVVVVDDKYGIRLTDIITPSDRLSRLNGRR